MLIWAFLRLTLSLCGGVGWGGSFCVLPNYCVEVVLCCVVVRVVKKNYFLFLPTLFWPTNLIQPPYKPIFCSASWLLKIKGLRSGFESKNKYCKICIRSGNINKNVPTLSSSKQNSFFWDILVTFLGQTNISQNQRQKRVGPKRYVSKNYFLIYLVPKTCTSKKYE